MGRYLDLIREAAGAGNSSHGGYDRNDKNDQRGDDEGLWSFRSFLSYSDPPPNDWPGAPPPLELRDGRQLYRIPASEIPATIPDSIIEVMARARRHGAVLVADGCELIVVAPALGLPRPLLDRLAAEAGAVIATLRGEHRRRTDGKVAP